MRFRSLIRPVVAVVIAVGGITKQRDRVGAKYIHVRRVNAYMRDSGGGEGRILKHVAILLLCIAKAKSQQAASHEERGGIGEWEMRLRSLIINSV